MADGVRILPLAEGGNPRSDEAITREDNAFVIEPYSEDGDANYKFRLDVELVNESDRPVATRIIVEWHDKVYSFDRTYLLICRGENEFTRHDARPRGTRVSRVLDVPPGRSRLALHPPYDYSRLCRFLDGLPRNLFSVRSIGSSRHGRDVFAVEIGDKAAQPLAVVTRVHPYETIASYFAEGMIEWLGSGSKEVADLIASHRILFIPMPNPDGVVEGTCKRTLGGVNFEDIAPDLETEPEVVSVTRYLMGQSIRAIFDIHGWMNDYHGYEMDDKERGEAIYRQLVKRADLFDRETKVFHRPLPVAAKREMHLGRYLAERIGNSYYMGSWAWFDRSVVEMKEMGVEVLRAFAGCY